MVGENPTWGAPRIHGELLMLGFDLSERTVSRWMKRPPRESDSAQRWLAFLRNHWEAIAAMDFFTVPTVTFGVLYGFFVLAHGRRRILHFNVTKYPTSQWIVQQLREAFPFESAPRFLNFRSRCEVWVGSLDCRAIPKDGPCANLLEKSLAERCGGAVGGELP